MLVDGKIPAGQPCPFVGRCFIAEAGKCGHKGKDHKVPFSCGAARAFLIADEDPGSDFDQMVTVINKAAAGS